MSTNAQSIELYNFYKRIGPNGLEESRIKEFTGQMLAMGLTKDQEKAGTSFSLFHRVANQVNEQEWLEFVQTSQLPAIKLSAKEMELVRGGIVLSITGILGCLGAGYYLARQWGR